MHKTSLGLILIVALGLLAAHPAPAFADLQIYFTTADAPGAYIVSADPPNNTIGVSMNNTFSLTFSDNMQDNSNLLNILQLKKLDGTVVPATLSFTSTTTLKVTPTSPLNAGAEYFIEFPQPTMSAGFDPLNSHNVPYWNVSTSSFQLHYTTGDAFQYQGADIGGITAPADTGSGPADVPITAVVKTTFSAALDTATVNTTTVQLYEGPMANGILVPIIVGLDAAGTVIQVTPVNPLKYATTYTLHIETGVGGVKNSNGTMLPG